MDHELLEAIARGLYLLEGGDSEGWELLDEKATFLMDAEALLAAVREAGFQWYRPDDCAILQSENSGEYRCEFCGERDYYGDRRDCRVPSGVYRLVPLVPAVVSDAS